MRTHAALALLDPLGPADLGRLVDIASERMETGHTLGWPVAVCGWWAILGAAAAAAQRLPAIGELEPGALDQLVAQVHYHRDEAAQDRRPALADVFATLLGLLVDDREGR